MHDRTIEDRLRSTLRGEADALPLTITNEELERRLAVRRRSRRDRRFGILAAGIAAIAITGVFSFAIGPFRRADVANPPLMSIGPSSAPSSLLPSPTPTPRVINPLGRVDEAILLRTVGDDPQRPSSFQVSVFDPVAGTSRDIATFPGTILPEDGWLEGGESPPTISLSGYLALPFTRGPNADETHSAIAVVDVLSPDTVPVILDGYTRPMWGPTEHLAVAAQGSSHVELFSIGSGFQQPAGNSESVTVVAWSAAEGARLVGTEGDSWGSIDFRGGFTPTRDLPAIFSRTGVVRPTGAEGHTLGIGCDSAPTGGECVLVESRAPEDHVAIWHRESEATGLGGYAWATDGRSVLLLLDRGGAEGRQQVDLVHAAAPDRRTTLATVRLPTSGTIIGIASEPTPGRPTMTALGYGDNVSAFVDGHGRVTPIADGQQFLGWADDPQPYDPD
jgi:hypothetical protein